MTTLLQRCTEAVAKVSPDREPHVHVAQVHAVFAVVAEHCDKEADKSMDYRLARYALRALAADLRRED